MWFSWLAGEVSSSDGEIPSSEIDEEEFKDEYDENLIGDEEDKRRLEEMTEKEREQELFDRMEKRALLKTRWTFSAYCRYLKTSDIPKKTVIILKWAASWQNQQNDCAASEDSDQPGHPPCLIRVFTVLSMGS